jgi:hypothetical protein
MSEIFKSGELTRKEAKNALMKLGFKQAVAYRALELGGRFEAHLSEIGNGILKWTA